jgi:DNA-directed RNA polymerase subunit RPC12/RpoP
MIRLGEGTEMRCIECDAEEVSERSERTAQGYRHFRCHACGSPAWCCARDCSRSSVDPLFQLLIIKPFGTAAEAVSLQIRDQQAQPLDLHHRRAQDQL